MKFKFKEGDKVICPYGVIAEIVIQIRKKKNNKYVRQYVVENSRGWRKIFYENHLKLIKEAS